MHSGNVFQQHDHHWNPACISCPDGKRFIPHLDRNRCPEPRAITRASYPISYLLEKLAVVPGGVHGIMHEPLIVPLSSKQGALTLCMVIGRYGTEAGPRSPFKRLSLCRFFISAPAAPALLELPHWLFCICRWKSFFKCQNTLRPITEDKSASVLLPAVFSPNTLPRLLFPLWLSSYEKCPGAARCLVFPGNVSQAVWSLQLGTASEFLIFFFFYRQARALMWLPQQETALNRWSEKN